MSGNTPPGVPLQTKSAQRPEVKCVSNWNYPKRTSRSFRLS